MEPIQPAVEQVVAGQVRKSVARTVRRLVLGGVLLVVVALAAGVFWIDKLAKAGVENGGTYALGVPTRLDSASIGLLQGRSRLAGLNVANPAGFDSPHLLKMDAAGVAVALGSLMSAEVEIPELTLSGIDVNLESRGGKANFKIVLDNLKRFESAETPAPANAAGKKYVIRNIVITNVKVNLALTPFSGATVRATVPLDELRLTDVGTGTSQGVILAQVTGTLLKAILIAAVEQGAGTMPAELLGELNQALAGLAPLNEIGAKLAVQVNGKLKELAPQIDAMKTQLHEQAGQIKAQLDQHLRGTTRQLEDAAKHVQDQLPGGLGGLLKQPERTEK